MKHERFEELRKTHAGRRVLLRAYSDTMRQDAKKSQHQPIRSFLRKLFRRDK